MESHEVDPNPCQLEAAILQRLSDLVSRAHARTSATGVAIALVEKDELVTCAASGSSAPEVGTRTPVHGSFSGRCAETGEMLICEDVATDKRVNGEACAAMGIFSMVMVPVSEGGTTRGVLAAFSDRPNSFSPSQLTVLNTFAEITNELLHHRDQASSGEVPTPVASVTDPSAKCNAETVLHDVLSAYEAERKSRADKSKPQVRPFPEPVRPAEAPAPVVLTPAPLSTVTPAASTTPLVAPQAAEPRPEKFGPQIVRPAASRGGAATKMAYVTEVAPKPEPPKPAESPKAAEPQEKSDLLSFAADPMPVRKAGQTIGNPKAERSSPMPDNGVFAAYEAQHAKQGSSPVKFVFAGAAVLVLAGAVFGFSRMHKTQSVSAATPVSEAVSTTQTPTPAATFANDAPTPAPESSASATPAAPAAKEVLKETKTAEESHRKEETKPLSPEKKVEAKQAEPVFIKTADGPMKKQAKDADIAPPTLMAGLSAGKMPEMKATVVPPKADFPTATVTAPKLLNGPRPAFPQRAAMLHLTSDTVVLNAKVLPNGKVGEMSVVRGHPVFVEAVKEAVKRWEYAPAQLNHQPTEATVEIVFKFGPGQ